MQIILYTKEIKKVSGVNTFERNFIKAIGRFFPVKYVYEVSEIDTSLLVDCDPIKNQGQTITGDICIYSTIFHNRPANIIADRYIQVVHTDLQAWNVKHEKMKDVEYVAVGEGVKESLKKDFGIESIVIPNILESVIRTKDQRALRLITASRLSRGKGLDRIIKVARELQTENRDFEWLIYGDGNAIDLIDFQFKTESIPQIQVMGSRENIKAYIENADFLVQLSDNEGFCYSVHEALQVGVPCIVTNWTGIDKVIKNGKNGFILNMDLGNLDIPAIYNFRDSKKLDPFQDDTAINLWFSKINE